MFGIVHKTVTAGAPANAVMISDPTVTTTVDSSLIEKISIVAASVVTSPTHQKKHVKLFQVLRLI
jgi:hypothetical protein